MNAKGKGQRPGAASIAIPDEEGPEPHPGRAGAPRKPKTGEGRGRVPPTPENAATARTRPISIPTHSRPVLAQARRVVFGGVSENGK